MRSTDEPETDFPAGARLPPGLQVVRGANFRVQDTGPKGDRKRILIEREWVDGDSTFAFRKDSE